MSGEQPVNPCTVPTFTGDLEALEHDYAAITAAAGTFRDAGANVDSEFQGLSAFYSAPEAAQLFATTQPVRTDSDFFADQMDAAAKALGEYVSEARPIAARLKELQARAAAFSDKISGDEHWKDDKKKTDENSRLISEISAAVAAFWAAEKTCADKLRALHGEPPLRYDDGSHGKDMYGYRLEDLNASKSLPWGTQFDQSHRWYEIDHWVKSFVWDGIVVDGIGDTLSGLGTLVGKDGWDKAGQAWTGLAKLGTGLALTLQPGMGVAYWTADDKAMPAWLRDSRNAMKETGKALVAWDEWAKNPARAAGAVTFNVLTTVFSGGVGTGAKTGAVAKTISVAGKAGRLIDPMTYVVKAGSFTFTKLKIGELFANLGKADGAFPKPDDVVWKDLPQAQTPAGARPPNPEATTRLPDDTLGRPQYLDKTTQQIQDHNFRPKQDLTAVPKGPDHPLAEVPKYQEVPVGVGARTTDVTSRTPGGAATHTSGGAASHTPGGTADNMPHNSHAEPGGGGTGRGGADATPTGGHADTPSVSGHGASGGNGNGPHRRSGDFAPTTRSGRLTEYERARSIPPEERTAAERAAITREHVRLVNEDDAWRQKHYNEIRRRQSIYREVDGQIIPQLVKNPEGGWMNADDLPFGDSEAFRLEPLERGRNTVSDDAGLQHLDDVSDRRWAGMELTDAQAKFQADPSMEKLEALRLAKESFNDRVGSGVANNTKLGEALGEEAARRHMLLLKEFEGAKEITDLPQTPNGSRRFDQLWRTKNGNLLIVEAKGPNGMLKWRQGNGTLDALTQVKQGALGYVRTVVSDMEDRVMASPKDGEYAGELRIAIKNKTLQYVLVTAAENSGRCAGAELKYFKIFEES
ncbi:hypothetical protein ACIPW5_16915 [Streptomyces sp. NPDC090077]|uniref:hypothetical protein n=1 Tax=Streptomyces sp. NPDC090077 TaxID=3365938 RepID=UPI00381FD99F